jgi:hypothetical protein
MIAVSSASQRSRSPGWHLSTYCPQLSLGWVTPQLTGEDAQNAGGYDLAKSRRGSSLSDQKRATSLI